VQVDDCEHWWFEDRGPQCTLFVFIDDATGRLMHLQFVESDTARSAALPTSNLIPQPYRSHPIFPSATPCPPPCFYS
jgi:hypothetical protein